MDEREIASCSLTPGSTVTRPVLGRSLLVHDLMSSITAVMKATLARRALQWLPRACVPLHVDPTGPRSDRCPPAWCTARAAHQHTHTCCASMREPSRQALPPPRHPWPLASVERNRGSPASQGAYSCLQAHRLRRPTGVPTGVPACGHPTQRSLPPENGGFRAPPGARGSSAAPGLGHQGAAETGRLLRGGFAASCCSKSVLRPHPDSHCRNCTGAPAWAPGWPATHDRCVAPWLSGSMPWPAH